jgi:hypothetical protein
MISDRTAVVLALVEQGWEEDVAHNLVARIEKAAIDTQPRPWRRWTSAEVAELDEALINSNWKVPGVKVTRGLAEQLGRSHKSVLSALDRRIAERG